MDKAKKEDVWKAFWDRQRTAQTPGVVSQEWNAISRAQFDAWADFSPLLPKNARVLDLATGFGKLPQMLRALRGDVSVVGVDIAEPLPPGSDGIELIGGISMEELPFGRLEFDALVSLFGFEYGDPTNVAREVLRVLKPDGPIGLMVHRGDGPILAHNKKREEQLHWAIEECGLFERVLEMLPSENSLPRKAVTFAAELAQEGQRRFGRGAVAWELPESVHRTLLMARQGTRQKLIETLKFIEAQAANELGRIASLTAACQAADDRERLLAGFTSADRRPQSTVPVALPEERPFADLIVL